MTKFLGGPAEGKVLQLRRSPLFLRVVVKGKEIDALDQLTDSPRPGELIYIYRRTKQDGVIHVHRAGSRGGFYPIAEYTFHDRQAHDSEVRGTGAWQAWCRNAVAQAKQPTCRNI